MHTLWKRGTSNSIIEANHVQEKVGQEERDTPTVQLKNFKPILA